MIKVTAVLSSKNITTLAEPCHTNIVRSHEIAGGEALCWVDQGEKCNHDRNNYPFFRDREMGRGEPAAEPNMILNTYLRP